MRLAHQPPGLVIIRQRFVCRRTKFTRVLLSSSYFHPATERSLSQEVEFPVKMLAMCRFKKIITQKLFGISAFEFFPV